MDPLEQAYQFFLGQGASPSAAAGISAGLYAESGLSPSAFNPAGGGQGAYGIGQWRGARQTALFSEFGSAPTLLQQLEFVWQELTGTEPQGSGDTGTYGGQTILGSSSGQSALSNFINDFEIPGPAGASGDIQRGTTALAQLGSGATPVFGGTTSQIPIWMGNALAPFADPFGLFGPSTLVSPGNTQPSAINGPGGIVSGGQQAAGASAQAIGSAVSAGVSAAIAPLNSWLSGLTSSSTVTRVTVGIVAVILLLAGIFFLANNKAITVNVPKAA